MAKSALLGVLESTIGKYIKDLDAQKLNLGIWSGQVELHDLQLDVEACNAELDRQAAEAPNLALPLKVMGGSFRSLKLEIPWTNLTTQSVVMKAQGLHVHVAPHDRLQETDFMKLAVSSEAKRAQHIREQRAKSIELADQNRLDANELMKLTQLTDEDDEDDNDNDKTKKKSGFVARLVKRIVENLQVDITDVQVSLEGKDGTAGVVLENMFFVTTDMGGHRTFVDRTGTANPNDLLNQFLYKKLKIEGCGIFVEPTSAPKHTYVLEPLNFEATLREADLSITQEYHRWLLRSKIPALQLGLSQEQYRLSMGLMNAMQPSPNAARPLFPQYRPLHRVTKKSAKDWWKYAYRCVGRLNGRRSWVIFYEAFKARKTYIALYKRKAHAESADWLTPLNPEEEEELKEIEADRTISVEGIMMWRNLADAQVEKERSKREAQQPKKSKKKGGMLSNLFGGKSKTSSDDEGNETPITLSTDELKELEDVGLEGITNASDLSNDAKLYRVEFVLGEFRIQMAKSSNRPMIGLEMGRVSSIFESDAGGSFNFEYKLQSLEILDHLHSSSLFPKIVRSLQGPDAAIKSPTPQDEDVFQMSVSKSKSGDKKLAVKLIPFEAVLAPHLMSEIMDFINIPETERNDTTAVNKSPQIEEIDDDDKEESDSNDEMEPSTKSEYAESLSNALVDAWQEKTKEKTSLSIDLDLQAPILVLPENCSDPNASVIVLDFGGFRFQYGYLDPSPKVVQWLEDNPRATDSNNLSNTSPGEAEESKFSPANAGVVVDHGRFELEKMTFLVGEAETWRRITSTRENHMAEQDSIIEPITIRFDFAVESVVSSSIPRACVFATVTQSNFKFSPNHLSMTLQVYTAWMNTLESIGAQEGKTTTNQHSKPALEEDKKDTSSSTSTQQSQPPQSTSGDRSTDDMKFSKVPVVEVNKAVEASLGKKNSLFTTMYLDISTEKYSFVVYDSGEFQKRDFDAKNSLSGSISPLANIAEGLVLQGEMRMSVVLQRDTAGSTSNSAVQISQKDFEIFSGFGRELRRPLQILEPLTCTLKVGLLSKGIETKKVDIKARCQDAIDMTVSMRNVSLVSAISREVSQCLNEGLKRASDSSSENAQIENAQNETLDEQTTNQIEAMASALRNEDDVLIQSQNAQDQPGYSPDVGNKMKRTSTSIIAVDVKVPETNFTIINDLQGLDEALFRVQTEDFTSKGMIAIIQDLDDTRLTETIFDERLHAKILADYFDPSVNLWKPLLKKPWEVAFKCMRSADKMSTNGRLSTKADIHFMPIHLTFSEHFLIGLGSASRMFSMSAEMEREDKSGPEESEKEGPRKSGFKPRASAVRHLVAALPYALDNFSGLDVEYFMAESRVGNRSCPNGTKEYFRFNPPKGKGHGGKRRYGQEMRSNNSIKIFIGDNTIEIERIDDQLGQPKKCHILNDGTMLVTTVVKEGLSTVIRLSGNVYMRNRTPFPARIAVVQDEKDFDVGVCEPTSSLVDESKPRLVPYNVKDGTLSKPSLRLGVRYDGMEALVKEWAEKKRGSLALRITPLIGGNDKDLNGVLELEADIETMLKAERNTIKLNANVNCTSTDDDTHDFVMQVAVKLQLIQGMKLVVNISLKPRAQLVNTIPVNLTVLTRLPHCYSISSIDKGSRKDSIHTIHELVPGSKIEVYSPGEAVAVKVRLADPPCRGTPTGTSRQWILIPLTSKLETPILCLLPFVTSGESSSALTPPGNEFFIAEATPALPDFFLERINDDGNLKDPVAEAAQSNKLNAKTFLFTVGSYAVDHTKSILFEQLVSKAKGFLRSSTKSQTLPFGNFVEQHTKRQLSLLPTPEIPIRLVMPGSSGSRRTALFRVEEVSMSEGGAQATPLVWDDGSQSPYYVYRKLCSSYQSELHVIPEFLIFNGSEKHQVIVKQKGSDDVSIDPGMTNPLYIVDRKKGLPLSFHYQAIGGSTKTIRLEELGLHIELVRTAEGDSLGSLAIQTSIGGNDSRLVVKLGEVGEIERGTPITPDGMLPASFINDNLRFRIIAEEFAVTLNQTVSASEDEDGIGTLHRAGSASGASIRSNQSAEEKTKEVSLSVKSTENPICTILMKNVVYDVQKLFKEKEELSDENDVPERCQLSLIIHDFKIRDETPNSPFPLVFNFTAKNRFLDFCVRTKGPLYGSAVHIDLLDAIIAHSGRGDDQSDDKMFFQTTETFVWALIDTADLIAQASKEGAQSGDKDDFDKVLAAYVPAYSVEDTVKHTPPYVNTIYDIALARVSPFNLVVSFKRNPDASRYKFVNNQGAHLMRYFTQQLKFTIDKCNLHFARYEESHLKGPMDRLMEILMAVYISRMKLKVVTILAAASFGDWKTLSARDGGDDEFVDGDLLRVTGSVAGNSVAFAFNKVGRHMGHSVTVGFEGLGAGIENGAALLGAKTFGSGVNAVVSGVGGGIGGTVKGVGEGAGNLFKGAGEGLGHFFGGISGGGSRIVKGVGKSITTGDGKALAKGFQEGLNQMGTGVQSSVKAVGSGVGGSVKSVVKGPVTGVKSSVRNASTRGDKNQSDLEKLREEFKDQDYS